MALPPRTQVYYVHLILEADDDGLVDRVQSIRKMLGANQRDLATLIDQGYLIPLPNGIVAITHWHIHNRVRKDTYTPTKYTNEWAALEIDATGKYRLRNDPVTQPDRERCAGKERAGKDSTVQDSGETDTILRQARELGIPVTFNPFLMKWFDYKAFRQEEQSPATIHSTLVQIKRNLDQHGEDAVGELIQLSIRNGWRGIFFDRLRAGNQPATVTYSTPDALYT